MRKNLWLLEKIRWFENKKFCVQCKWKEKKYVFFLIYNKGRNIITRTDESV